MATVTFSGLASGIDSDALIQAMSDASRAARVKPWETKVTELEDADSALEELTTKLTSLQTLVRGFATINGGPVAKEASSSNESVLTATASTSAANGSYGVTVSQLAKNGTYTLASLSRTYTDTLQPICDDIDDGAAEADRRVRVTLGTGSSQEVVDVVLTSTSSVSDFVTEFNSNATLATASIINVGTSSSPDYQIMIQSQTEGTEKGSVSVSIGTEITNPTGGTVPRDGAFDDNSSVAATNAEFTVDGVSGTITRQTNTVADLIPGVTFQLQSTSASKVTVSIGTDADTTVETAKKFVDAYNDIVNYIKENNLIERQESNNTVTNTFGTLAKTRVDDSVLSALRSQIAAATADHTGLVAIFSDLGITTQRDGTLALDEEVFKDALAEDPAAVAEIMENFADATSLTGGTIDQFIRFNGLIDLSINANKNSITSMNDRISQAEAAIEKQADMMKKRFATLESTMARMQSQQQGLMSALGLSSK